MAKQASTVPPSTRARRATTEKSSEMSMARAEEEERLRKEKSRKPRGRPALGRVAPVTNANGLAADVERGATGHFDRGNGAVGIGGGAEQDAMAVLLEAIDINEDVVVEHFSDDQHPIPLKMEVEEDDQPGPAPPPTANSSGASTATTSSTTAASIRQPTLPPRTGNKTDSKRKEPKSKETKSKKAAEPKKNEPSAPPGRAAPKTKKSMATNGAGSSSASEIPMTQMEMKQEIVDPNEATHGTSSSSNALPKTGTATGPTPSTTIPRNEDLITANGFDLSVVIQMMIDALPTDTTSEGVVESGTSDGSSAAIGHGSEVAPLHTAASSSSDTSNSTSDPIQPSKKAGNKKNPMVEKDPEEKKDVKPASKRGRPRKNPVTGSSDVNTESAATATTTSTSATSDESLDNLTGTESLAVVHPMLDDPLTDVSAVVVANSGNVTVKSNESAGNTANEGSQGSRVMVHRTSSVEGSHPSAPSRRGRPKKNPASGSSDVNTEYAVTATTTSTSTPPDDSRNSLTGTEFSGVLHPILDASPTDVNAVVVAFSGNSEVGSDGTAEKTVDEGSQESRVVDTRASPIEHPSNPVDSPIIRGLNTSELLEMPSDGSESRVGHPKCIPIAVGTMQFEDVLEQPMEQSDLARISQEHSVLAKRIFSDITNKEALNISEAEDMGDKESTIAEPTLEPRHIVEAEFANVGDIAGELDDQLVDNSESNGVPDSEASAQILKPSSLEALETSGADSFPRMLVNSEMDDEQSKIEESRGATTQTNIAKSHKVDMTGMLSELSEIVDVPDSGSLPMEIDDGLSVEVNPETLENELSGLTLSTEVPSETNKATSSTVVFNTINKEALEVSSRLASTPSNCLESISAKENEVVGGLFNQLADAPMTYVEDSEDSSRILKPSGIDSLVNSGTNTSPRLPVNSEMNDTEFGIEEPRGATTEQEIVSVPDSGALPMEVDDGSDIVLLENGQNGLTLAPEVAPETITSSSSTMNINPHAHLDTDEEMDVDLERKRKTNGESSEAKRHCPDEEDVPVGKFTCFVTSSQRQTREEFLKTLIELRLVPSVETKEVMHLRCSTYVQDLHQSDFWCVEFVAMGRLTQKLRSLLSQSNRIEELDSLNRSTYGTESSKRVHFGEEMTEADMARTSFLLILQRLLGSCFTVDSLALVAQLGRRISISQCFVDYSEQATRAYQLLNRCARKDINRTIPVEIQKRLHDDLGAETVLRLRDAIARMNGPEGVECHSLLKRCLTEDIIQLLKNRKTECGKTLLNCIDAGLRNFKSEIGVFAVAPDAYTRFDVFFERIIEDYHGYRLNKGHPASDFGEGSDFPELDPEGHFVISTRIRCVRSVKGFPFQSLTKDKYKVLEGMIKRDLLKYTDNDLKGNYYSLEKYMPQEERSIITSHFLRNGRNVDLMQTGATDHWPVGRGVFRNSSNTFTVIVNVDEHLRFESMETGSHVGRVLERLKKGVEGLGAQVRYLRNKRLGWLTHSPANLGSTIRASVKIRLPKLTSSGRINELCESVNLKARRLEEGEGSVHIISNKNIMGVTEREAVSQMYEGVSKLIRMETEAI